jgi:hypothetical protein
MSGTSRPMMPKPAVMLSPNAITTLMSYDV